MHYFPHSLAYPLMAASFSLQIVSTGSPALAQERRFERVTWESIGGVSPSDSLLVNPVRLEVDSSALYVYDAADFRVRAFSWRGQHLWSFGREGSGPAEFRNVLALRLTKEHELFVYDHGNSRVLVMSTAGRLQRQFSLTSSILPGGVTPLAQGAFLAQAFVRSPFLTLFNSTGKPIRQLAVPTDLVGRDMIQARLMAGTTTSDWTVWSSVYTDRLYFVEASTDSTLALRGVHPIDFPKTQPSSIRTPDGKTIRGVRPDPANVTGGVAISAVGDTVFVLIGSAAQKAFQTLDLYSLRSVRYLGSILLPEPCTSLVAIRTAIACLQNDPAPQLKLWRLNHSSR